MPMLAVTVIVACDNIAFSQIFPYLAFLIVHLHMVEFDYQVGRRWWWWWVVSLPV